MPKIVLPTELHRTLVEAKRDARDALGFMDDDDPTANYDLLREALTRSNQLLDDVLSRTEAKVPTT